MNELVELGEDAFAFPLFVTSTGIVIDGYARLEIARLQGRETIMCVEFDIPEEEALRRLILCHRRLAGLPAFCRIKLPNNLLPWMNSPLMDSSTTTRSGIIVTPPHAHAPFILQLHGLCGRIAVEKPITSDAWETRVLPPLALGTRPVLPMDHKLFTGVVCI